MTDAPKPKFIPGRAESTKPPPVAPTSAEPDKFDGVEELDISETSAAEAETVGPEQSSEPAASDVQRLGASLARALQEDNYYPVILFGTNNSGKTSLLLSLFSTLIIEPELETGLFLCDPILGTTSGVGRQLHAEAEHTFEVKTQAFIDGEKIPKTNVQLPFFVPVELRPQGKPAVRFAFLESNGEWYRTSRDLSQPIGNRTRLYPKLREEIEDFIASFQGGITFLYLVPYTQGEVYADRDGSVDTEEIQNASLAIAGVLRAYDKVRANHRADDRHLMLVTKWDAHSAKANDRAEGIEADDAEVLEFCTRKYSQAISTFQGLNLIPGHRMLNAYCSGLINERGALQVRDPNVKSAVLAYPVRLWKWLYGNALEAASLPLCSPFREEPEPPALVKLWERLLGFVAGR